MAALLIALAAGFPGPSPAAEVKIESPAPPAVADLQKQIDELVAGQQQMRTELQELKALLTVRELRPKPAPQPPPASITLNVHGEAFRGDVQAKVAIVEYSDFDCSFCARYANETLPLIDRDYIAPGRIKYFFRDLPELAQTNSVVKACAARCAGEQGRFWEMHDRLFAAQAAPGELAPQVHAQALGLDVAAFNACLASDRYPARIRRSAEGARQLGVFGTPAFLIGTLSADGDFLNSTNVLLGVESYEAVKSVLDSVLATSPASPTK